MKKPTLFRKNNSPNRSKGETAAKFVLAAAVVGRLATAYLTGHHEMPVATHAPVPHVAKPNIHSASPIVTKERATQENLRRFDKVGQFLTGVVLGDVKNSSAAEKYREADEGVFRGPVEEVITYDSATGTLSVGEIKENAAGDQFTDFGVNISVNGKARQELANKIKHNEHPGATEYQHLIQEYPGNFYTTGISQENPEGGLRGVTLDGIDNTQNATPQTTGAIGFTNLVHNGSMPVNLRQFENDAISTAKNMHNGQM